MQNKTPLPPIPAKRYFREQEICELSGISVAGLEHWLKQQDDAQGLNPHRFYSRQQLLALRQAHNRLQDYGFGVGQEVPKNNAGEPAFTAQQVRNELELILHGLSSSALEDKA